MKKERKKTKNFPSNGNSSSYIQEGALEASLKDSFKLSGYEARAYISLVKKGAQNAKQLSQNASIPLPRVYDTLDTLMEKALLQNRRRKKKAIFFQSNLLKRSGEGFSNSKSSTSRIKRKEDQPRKRLLPRSKIFLAQDFQTMEG